MNIRRVIDLLVIIPLVVVSFLLSACASNPEEDEISTVVIINPLGPLLQQFVTGFSEGMVEAGYIDGQTVSYIYSETPENMSPPAIEASIDAVLRDNSDIDLVVCISTSACVVAKSILENTQIPLLFMGVTDPIGTGLISDFTEIDQTTGIASAARNAANEGRSFEWLIQIAPAVEEVFIPHDPDDAASSTKLEVVQNVANNLGITLIIFEVKEEADLDAALNAIPEETDAVVTFSESIFTVPFMTALNDIAIERNLPHLSFSTQYGQMISYAPDTHAIGKQAAVLGARILDGTPVAELPVEIPEFKLYINLATADAMRFEISDQILRQAVVIRSGEE